MSHPPWVLASQNVGKLRELEQLLRSLGREIISQDALGIPAAEEPHATFLENALAKARNATRLSGYPALADDSGLCVEALNGAPGVVSAHYAGFPRSDQRNNTKLVEDLAGVPHPRAHYVCVLVWLRHYDDPEPVIAQGCWHGEIVTAPAGEGGFGYDPHFYLPEQGCTVAQLSLEQKNRLSHRALALRELLELIRGHLPLP